MYYYHLFFNTYEWDPWKDIYPISGIRQGDPLSPYIVILCAEILARNKFPQASISGSRDIGVKLGHSRVKIPFLTFADDTMIFARATEDSCHTIKDILDKYCSIYGQFVNFHKSAFQCTQNVDGNVSKGFSSILQMEETLVLGKYLSCPIICTKVTSHTFVDIREKVASQLSNWKANSLSQSGLTILIQSNLSTKDNFQMQTFSLPPSINLRMLNPPTL